jgi:hypothetical protein
MKNNTKFIKFVKDECEKHSIKCVLEKTKFISCSDEIKCGGYFDEGKRELVVAMGRLDSIELFVHEYSHMTQYLEGLELWNKCMDLESHDKMDRWLAGEYFDDIDYHIDNCRDLELDNEKRAVKLIKKFNLEIDIDKYIKKSNAYIQFYNYMKLSRKWSVPKNSPYRNKRIIDNCPAKFSMDYSKISKKLENIFREENIGFPKSKVIKKV